MLGDKTFRMFGCSSSKTRTVAFEITVSPALRLSAPPFVHADSDKKIVETSRISPKVPMRLTVHRAAGI